MIRIRSLGAAGLAALLAAAPASDRKQTERRQAPRPGAAAAPAPPARQPA